MRRYVLWVGLGLLAGLSLVLVLAAAVGLGPLARPYILRGSQINPPITAPDFDLKDAQGLDFQLSSQRGKVVMIFFGYTSCPDVCPSTLSEMKLVRTRLGKAADHVRFVFITVDPQRDTPEHISKYVANFDPTFIGLSGSEQYLAPIWKAYGVYRAIRDLGSSAGYLVDHSSQVYVIDRSGNLRTTYSFGTPVDDIVSDMKFLVKEKLTHHAHPAAGQSARGAP